MDTLRGNFADHSDPIADADDFDPAEDDTGRDAPPPEIGQDERRMQVRAYNHWASLLQDRNFPSIDDLVPENLPDFGPYSVLLDFTGGIEDPGISYLGDKLAAECGAVDEIHALSEIPSRSLLSRITDHYMQILANQAPIGFEAEFVNQRGITILYRGILLPFSSDDDTIDFIYGVINWKELADQQTTDELMLEIDQALDDEPEAAPQRHDDTPITDWADGPAADIPAEPETPNEVVAFDTGDTDWDAGETAMPAPSFGASEPETDDEAAWSEETSETESQTPETETDTEAEQEAEVGQKSGSGYASLTDLTPGTGSGDKEPLELELDDAYELADEEQSAEFELERGYEFDGDEDGYEEFGATELETAQTAIDIPDIDESEMELGDWLASARELAMAARSSEDRTRNALYDAIGRAYDFSLAAAQAPEEFDELVADSGLTMQDRAPMTPVVKLVFGTDYDKTRLTEYAAALSYAHRNELERGTLAEYLRKADGGLKGVVKAERRARREEAGKPVEPDGAPRERLAKKLRQLEPLAFDAISSEGQEFALVMIRRTPEGEVVMLGEVPDDVALVERAARKLID
jgi:hypothetical protein